MVQIGVVYSGLLCVCGYLSQTYMIMVKFHELHELYALEFVFNMRKTWDSVWLVESVHEN